MLGLLRECALFAQVAAPGREVESLREQARNLPTKGPGPDLMLILAIVLGLAAILFFWAFFIRKRPRRAHGALVVQRRDDSQSASGRRRRRKRRPGHPDNWGRNPTLGETGGLPPSRPEEPEAPSEPQAPPAR